MIESVQWGQQNRYLTYNLLSLLHSLRNYSTANGDSLQSDLYLVLIVVKV